MDNTFAPSIGKKPGGARPNPGSRPESGGPARPSGAGDVPRLIIPPGNVPGIHVDQAGEGGWHQPASLPSLALRPMRPSPTPSSSSRPKLSLTPLTPNTPAASSSAPSSASLAPPNRPALLNTHSARGYGERSTPSLKLSIPGASSVGPGYSTENYYPLEQPDDIDALSSELKTPTPGRPPGGGLNLSLSSLSLASSEDANPTLQARGRDYDDGESSYGYGCVGNGLIGPGGDVISAMTEDIRQALSRNRFETGSDRGGARSRAGSLMSESSQATAGRDRSNSASLYSSASRRESPSASLSGGSARQSLELPREAVEELNEQKESPVFDPEELLMIKRLGEGTGGSVDLVQDRATGRIMAKKVITRTSNPMVHKQLLRELEILNSCASPFIVEHYGSFLADHDSSIGILMEYCEAGSLDSLLGKMKKKNMRCSEHVLGRVASSVLKGLDYLHQRRIIHRDIKPSNILITRQGAVKLCDFGVSGELVESLAGTFTGTSFYMAPERIQNKPYSIKADVWSLAPVPIMIDDPSVGRVWSEPIKDFMGQWQVHLHSSPKIRC
ncbi:STE/STE7/MKK protein kinase [Cryptococcus deuterogattii MMRL2647]|nr:STE/STE7/MKK protein kinase [Cryptococcus deuterogattii MMRL2647]